MRLTVPIYGVISFVMFALAFTLTLRSFLASHHDELTMGAFITFVESQKWSLLVSATVAVVMTD